MSVRRVAIVTIQPLFSDILRQVLAGQAAIEIVAQIDRRSRLRQRLRAARPDFILIGLRRGETDAVALSILTALPNAKVVAFSNDFHRVWVHQMQPHRTEMHDFSLDAMIALVKRLT